nr:unnamed protein product [Digitaria exilis]
MAIGWELTDDLIADVLRRLPPRSLAVSRCVCRSWRGLVDARRLLRADLLPRSVGGIYSSEFFALPATGPSISGHLEFIPGFFEVLDHCNGLLLLTETSDDHAMSATLERGSGHGCQMEEADDQIECLVYDPTVSPHYKVFLIPSHPDDQPKSMLDPDMKRSDSEWPPSSYALQVFSSTTGCWEERSFVLEGGCSEEGGPITDIKVYWREALYVLCENGFILRMSMKNAKYRVLPMPSDVEYRNCLSLGKSEKGVYCAFEHECHGLRIFLLNESCGQVRWELKHLVDLKSFAQQ